jgi:hypothetical protein
MPDSKTSKLSIQLVDKLNKTIQLFPSDPSMLTQVGSNLNPK